MVGKGELIESIGFRDFKTKIFQRVLPWTCFWSYNCNQQVHFVSCITKERESLTSAILRER